MVFSPVLIIAVGRHDCRSELGLSFIAG